MALAMINVNATKITGYGCEGGRTSEDKQVGQLDVDNRQDGRHIGGRTSEDKQVGQQPTSWADSCRRPGGQNKRG